MHEFNSKKLGIRTLLAKKLSFKKLEKNDMFKEIFRKNKEIDKSLAYKFKYWRNRHQSISNQVNVCLFTGKNRSIVNECGLKRQIFKRTVMQNYVSAFKKKHN